MPGLRINFQIGQDLREGMVDLEACKAVRPNYDVLGYFLHERGFELQILPKLCQVSMLVTVLTTETVSSPKLQKSVIFHGLSAI